MHIYFLFCFFYYYHGWIPPEYGICGKVNCSHIFDFDKNCKTCTKLIKDIPKGHFLALYHFPSIGNWSRASHWYGITGVLILTDVESLVWKYTGSRFTNWTYRKSVPFTIHLHCFGQPLYPSSITTSYHHPYHHSISSPSADRCWRKTTCKKKGKSSKCTLFHSMPCCCNIILFLWLWSNLAWIFSLGIIQFILSYLQN